MGSVALDSFEYFHFLTVKTWYRAQCTVIYRHVVTITSMGSKRRTQIKAMLQQVGQNLFKTSVYNASTRQEHMTKQHIAHMLVQNWPRDLVWPLDLSWEALIA